MPDDHALSDTDRIAESQKKADEELGRELARVEELNEVLKGLAILVDRLKRARLDQFVGQFESMYQAVLRALTEEQQILAGKQEVIRKINSFSHITPAGARNEIEKLIESEEAEARSHLERGTQLLAGAASDPQKFPLAAAEFARASEELRKVMGKRKVLPFY